MGRRLGPVAWGGPAVSSVTPDGSASDRSASFSMCRRTGVFGLNGILRTDYGSFKPPPDRAENVASVSRGGAGSSWEPLKLLGN